MNFFFQWKTILEFLFIIFIFAVVLIGGELTSHQINLFVYD